MVNNESWLNYNLPYEKINYNPGETTIYAIINKDSKRLYIGKTMLYPLKERMRYHQNGIQKVLGLKASGIITSTSAHTKMAQDIENGNVNFIYSAIKNINKPSVSQTSQIENSVIFEASQQYKRELYNVLKKNVYSGKTVQDPAGLNSIPTEAKKTTRLLPKNPFIINGIWYETSFEAIAAAGVSSYQTLKLRAGSFSFPNIISVKKPVGKTLPSTKEIKDKVDNYYRRYGKPTNNGDILTVV
jgi:hypothetical protein